ncbi:MAG: tRNA threonylcarbamoyladenosine biosynthesis protein TsaE [Cyclobacteriaceae bacterium]|jgi:tRNA threonylcarbamoyladenosine biosynthesis protein TsaE
MTTFNISTIADLKAPAQKVAELLSDYPVACFYGEMGVGKTTFIKVICNELAVVDSTSSPTFAIVNEYQDGKRRSIYHFDFYRIKNIREAQDIGTEEYFYSGDPCLIEWPEMIKELIPEQHLEISIKLVGITDRELTITIRG